MSASTKRGRNGSEDSEDGASGDASENEDLDAGAPEEDAEGRAAAAKQRRMAINRRTAHSSRIRKKQVREDGGEEEERRGRRSRLCYPVRVRNVVLCVCVVRYAHCAVCECLSPSYPSHDYYALYYALSSSFFLPAGGIVTANSDRSHKAERGATSHKPHSADDVVCAGEMLT